MARVLLIHTARYWIPPDGRIGDLDVTHASFVPSSIDGKIVGGPREFPDPLEFEAIVSDYANLLGNSRIDVEAREGPEAARAPLRSTAGLDAAATEARMRQKDLTSALYAGNTAIVIAGPEPNLPYGTFSLPRTLNWGEANAYAGEAKCIWNGGLPDEMRALQQEFQNEWRWERSIECTSWTPPMPCGSMNQSLPALRLPMPPPVKELCVNRQGKIVGAIQRVGRGEVLILPNVPDPRRRCELVRYLLEEYLPSRHPELRPWIVTAWPKVLSARLRAIAAEERSEKTEIEARKLELSDLQRRVLGFRGLLSLKSEPLKQLVAKALAEVFGLEVRDLDAEGGPKRFDLLVRSGEVEFAVDVSGKQTGSLKTKDLDDLERKVRAFASSERLQPVLIVNAGCSFPPTDPKRRIDPAQVKDAQSRGICVLSTITLFDLLGDVVAAARPPESLLSLLRQQGLASIENVVNSPSNGHPNT